MEQLNQFVMAHFVEIFVFVISFAVVCGLVLRYVPNLPVAVVVGIVAAVVMLVFISGFQ